jgi:hypothetical protein
MRFCLLKKGQSQMMSLFKSLEFVMIVFFSEFFLSRYVLVDSIDSVGCRPFKKKIRPLLGSGTLGAKNLYE